MQAFISELERYPLIAAVRDSTLLKEAVESRVSSIFLLGGTIFDLPDMIDSIHKSHKYAFLHIDLISGIAKDEVGVKWCVEKLHADGIISTRPQLIRAASHLGAITIQRLFLMDSSSFEHGVKLLRNTPTDMAEVLPGIAPKAIRRLKDILSKPVIAGGMITDKSDIMNALDAGASAVSLSDPKLFNCM